MPHQIIDTHIHVWNFDRAEYSWLDNDTSILNRTYDIDEIDEERKQAGITKGVLVQAANNLEDTDWMLEVAQNTDWIAGVVGWLPLMQPRETLNALNDKYTSNKYFKGVRHLIHDEHDAKWLLQSEVIESLKILVDQKLPFDVVGVLPAHIETVLEVSNKVPGLQIVFDHLNQPPIASKEKFGVWGELIKEASKNKNFHAKISGLGTTCRNPGWNSDDIKPYVGFILQHFGTDRCFCGGDWPVSLLAGSYAKTWETYKNVIDSLLNEDEREKVYCANATNFYRLN